MISGAAVESVSVHSQSLHAVLVGGVKRVAGGDAALSTLCHLKHLEITGTNIGDAPGCYRNVRGRICVQFPTLT